MGSWNASARQHCMAAGYNGPSIRNYPFVMFLYFLSYNHLFIQNIDIFIHSWISWILRVGPKSTRPSTKAPSKRAARKRAATLGRPSPNESYLWLDDQSEAPCILLGPWSYAATGMERELLTIPTIDHIDH